MFKIKTCPVCKSNKIKKFFTKKNFPYFTSPLSNKEIKLLNIILKNKKKYSDLDVSYCLNCSHSFLKKLPDMNIINKLYNKFYNYPSPLSKGFEPIRDNNFLKIFNNFFKSKFRKKILEIGCFDGYIINKLKKKYDVYGCDPSPGALIGKRKKLKIQRSFFSPNIFKKIKFDIIIARHIIEHVENLDDFLSSISYKMKDGSKLIFETPNSDFFLKRGLPSVFSLQHLHYFNKYSLSFFLKKNNFKILKIVLSEENIIIIAEKKISKFFLNYKKNFKLFKSFKISKDKNIIFIKNIIKKLKIKNNQIVIWGAGGFGIGFLKYYNIDLKFIKNFIDIDKKKAGKTYYGLKKPIFLPLLRYLKSTKLIIITSMYSNQILKQLKEHQFKGKIISLFPELKIYNDK